MVFLILFSIPSAFAEVDIVEVDIFCNSEILFGFIGLLSFLEICPINTGTLPPPLVSVSINDASAPEGTTNDRNELIFTASLDSSSVLPVSVDFATSELSSATAGLDYVETSGTIEFEPGETEQTIIVTLIGDSLPEADEVFAVSLFNCNNCELGDFIGIGKIPAGNESLSLAQKAVLQTWSDSWGDINAVLIFGLSDTLISFTVTGPLCIASLVTGPGAVLACSPLIAELALIAIPLTLESLTQELANDPPDSNFQTVFEIPDFQTFEPIGENELQITSVKLINALSKEEALLQAFLTSFERYQGAGLANENEFVILQLFAVKTYSDLLVENHLELEEILLQHTTALQNGIDIGELESIQLRLESEGFSQNEIQNFLNNGYSQERITEIKEGIMLLDTNNIAALTGDLEEFTNTIAPVTGVFQKFSNDLEEFSDNQNLQSQKLSVIDTLESLKTDDKKSDKKIDKVIKHITKSTDDKFWSDDGTTLDDKKSKKVFDEERKAVKGLMKIVKKGGSGIDTEISDVIVILVDIDRELVQDAINDAKVFEGDKKVDKEIEKAEKELAKGDKEASKGKFDKAIDKYKKAWEHAQKALKKKK